MILHLLLLKELFLSNSPQDKTIFFFQLKKNILFSLFMPSVFRVRTTAKKN